jgi:hypothetical protein
MLNAVLIPQVIFLKTLILVLCGVTAANSLLLQLLLQRLEDFILLSTHTITPLYNSDAERSNIFDISRKLPFQNSFS